MGFFFPFLRGKRKQCIIDSTRAFYVGLALGSSDVEEKKTDVLPPDVTCYRVSRICVRGTRVASWVSLASNVFPY